MLISYNPNYLKTFYQKTSCEEANRLSLFDTYKAEIDKNGNIVHNVDYRELFKAGLFTHCVSLGEDFVLQAMLLLSESKQIANDRSYLKEVTDHSSGTYKALSTYLKNMSAPQNSSFHSLFINSNKTIPFSIEDNHGKSVDIIKDNFNAKYHAVCSHFFYSIIRELEPISYFSLPTYYGVYCCIPQYKENLYDIVKKSKPFQVILEESRIEESVRKWFIVDLDNK